MFFFPSYLYSPVFETTARQSLRRPFGLRVQEVIYEWERSENKKKVEH